MITTEIWSDVVCPFCYIGKRNFEKALEQLQGSYKINIRWRSFELSPGLKTDPSKSIYEHLAEQNGWSQDQSRQIHRRVTETAEKAGLAYNFDQTFPVNSFKAHRMLHLAAKHRLQNKLKERLFAAHFTEGKNIDDGETLLMLGEQTGMPAGDIRDLFRGDMFTDAVRSDITTARHYGIQGVPFFVFNRKYAVSGAQPLHAFLEVLQKIHKETDQQNQNRSAGPPEGAAFCTPEGDC